MYIALHKSECAAMVLGLISLFALSGMSVWLTVIAADALTDSPSLAATGAATPARA
jgi:hypothetical protein